jgi:uncharacterized membrane protein
MANATETLKFNVGGRHFEVSRALIHGHSKMVLGKLCPKTGTRIWTKPFSLIGAVIYLQTCWNIFAVEGELISFSLKVNIHVCSYPCINTIMLIYYLIYHGIIELPITILCSIFDQKLDYYGITTFKDNITDHGSFVGGFRTLKLFVKVNRKYEMYLLLVESCYKFCQTKNAVVGASVSVNISIGHKLYNGRHLDSEEKELLEK